MFKDKVVLITGGSSGIGEATALLFAQEGASVAITYKTNKEGAEKVVSAVEKLGAKALALQADLVNEKEAGDVIAEVLKEFGKLDVLVNNAGKYVEGDEWDGGSDVWLKSLQQNLVSAMNVSRFALKEFMRRQSGVMINVSSRHGIRGHADALSYSAAKAGIISITQAYAELLAPFGRANSVSPSATKAGYWLTAPQEELQALLENRPNHRLVEPETVAKKILFLASDEAKEINGENFPVNE